jgi:hypothetical protein
MEGGNRQREQKTQENSAFAVRAFEVGQRQGSTSRTTVLEATVLLDDNVKQVWKGSRMVNDRRLVCEESQGVEEEDE